MDKILHVKYSTLKDILNLLDKKDIENENYREQLTIAETIIFGYEKLFDKQKHLLPAHLDIQKFKEKYRLS